MIINYLGLSAWLINNGSQNIVIHPGIHPISSDKWETVIEHYETLEMIDSGVLKVISMDDTKIENAIDISREINIDKCFNLIDGVFDEGCLEAFLQQERSAIKERPAVTKKIQKQLSLVRDTNVN